MLVLALFLSCLAILSVIATDGNFTAKYIGCYQDHQSARILDGLDNVPDYDNPIRSRHNMTVMFCAAACYRLNFTYAASSTQRSATAGRSCQYYRSQTLLAI